MSLEQRGQVQEIAPNSSICCLSVKLNATIVIFIKPDDCRAFILNNN
jgi:hypothetical protein